MTIKEIYEGKTILLTGVTGFVGKVILQKFLFSVPTIKKIYVLIREKKGSNLKQRFAREIISSPCFDRIRNVHHHKFFDFINQKVQPIQGDIVKPNLNLSHQDMEKIIKNCTIIINCAASIDFNARLDEAISSNIIGSLNMLQLGHRLQLCQIFTHVSTAYVNCDKTGFIKEDIYDAGIDPQEQFKYLTNLPLKELVEQSSNIIKKFPNTYTFTKNLGQKLLAKRRKNLTMCIIRPTIINNAYYEPFPGWIDSIAAAAAFFLFGGLGILKQVQGEKNNIGDQIPVDLVSNYIIVATAYNINKQNQQIYHIGTSDRNPTKWALAEPIIRDYWKSNISQYRISEPNGIMSNNSTIIKLHKFKQRVPAYIYFRLAPFMGKQHVRKTEKMKKAFKRADQIQHLFRFFMTNEWIFEMRRIKDLLNFLSDSDKKSFIIDPAELDMRYYFVLNNYSLQKYILKENVQQPTADNFDLLKSGSKKSYFQDISWALSEGSSNMKYGQGEKIKRQILTSKIMLQAIQDETLKRIQKHNANMIFERKRVQQEAQNIVKQIVGQFKQPVVRFLAWALHKIFNRLYEKVNLNQEIFQKLREIQEVNGCPIVLMPTHRSYIDFLMVSYIMFNYKLKMPHVVSDQSYLSIKIVDYFVSNAGAFFFKKGKYKSSQLYKVAFDLYIQKLLVQGNNLQFFIEGVRSKTGKMLEPQTQVLEILVDCITTEKVKDVCIVPLTINYQKVLEGDTLPAQLLGQDRHQQSLLRLIRAAPLLNINFGRVYVQFADFVFLKDQLLKEQSKKLSLKTQSENIKQLTQNFGYKLIRKMQNKLVIMSTGVVATALLMYRKGVTEDLLLKTVHWLAKYIIKKGYKIGSINQNSAALAIRNAMTYLSGVIIKTKNSIFELQIIPGKQFEKLLMLSYYRNTVFHAFLPEAYIGTALASFGSHLNRNEGVPIQRLYQQSAFLRDMFRAEHIASCRQIFDFETFKNCLNLMIRHDVIVFKEKEQKKIIFKDYQEKFIHLYCSLMKPLVQCYWAVLLYLMTIASSPNQVQEINSLQKFFRYIQYYMQALHDQKVLENHEACSMQTIKNAFESYRKRGLVTVTVQTKHLIRIEAKASQMEAYKQLQTVLKNFVKNSLVTSLISPMDFAKNLVIGSQLSKL